MNRLTLAPTTRQIEPMMASDKTVRTFLDFVVDGRPLYEIMTRSGFDNISSIWLDSSAPIEVERVIRRLMGAEPADAPGERVSVYVCPECGELGCGAVTVDLTISEHQVTWSDWGYQTDYEQAVHRDDVPSLGTLVFDRGEYERVFNEALHQIADGER